MDTVQLADGSSLIMGRSRGGTGGLEPPGKSQKYIFFINTGPGPVENLEAKMTFC